MFKALLIAPLLLSGCKSEVDSSPATKGIDCKSEVQPRFPIQDINPRAFSAALNAKQGANQSGVQSITAKRVKLNSGMLYIVLESLGSGMIHSRLLIFSEKDSSALRNHKWLNEVTLKGDVAHGFFHLGSTYINLIKLFMKE